MCNDYQICHDCELLEKKVDELNKKIEYWQTLNRMMEEKFKVLDAHIEAFEEKQSSIERILNNLEFNDVENRMRALEAEQLEMTYSHFNLERFVNQIVEE